MCNMDEIRTRIVPIRLVLILTICLSSLATHFLAECNGQNPHAITLELIDDGRSDNPDHSAGVDSFILPESSERMDPQSQLRIACPARSVFASLASLPLLPPPIKG